MSRTASVMGRFYPADKDSLLSMVSQWKQERTVLGARAALVPHAGHVYSGECAWRALTMLDWTEFDRVVIVGPSHRFPFQGLSIYKGSHYETVESYQSYDEQYASQLRNELQIPYIEQAHFEHSTEVQVPLISLLAPKIAVVECVYGERSELKLETLLSTVLTTPKTALLISSDLSHYYSEMEAINLDNHIVKAIETMDPQEVDLGEACGKAGIRALINYCRDHQKRLSTVDYRTSASAPQGDSNRVVGYLSAIMQ